LEIFSIIDSICLFSSISLTSFLRARFILLLLFRSKNGMDGYVKQLLPGRSKVRPVNISLRQCQIKLKYQNNKPSHCYFNFLAKKVFWSEICGYFVDFGGIFIRKNHSAAI